MTIQMEKESCADIVRYAEEALAKVNEIAEEDGMIFTFNAKEKARVKKAQATLRKIRGSALKRLSALEKETTVGG